VAPCPRNNEVTASLPLLSALEAAGGDQLTFRLVGVDIDKTHMHAGKGFAALHVDDVVNDTCAVRQMAPVPAAEGAGNRDVFDRIVVAIAEREGDQGLRPQPAPSSGLR